MKIQKPDAEALEPIIKEATESQTIEEWIPKLLAAIKTVLLKSPDRYRSYGPYWWLIKQMFIDRGDYSFGTHVDKEWHEAMDYGYDKFNLVAAFVYGDYRFESGLMADSYHTVEDDESENSIEFMSDDEEMEIMAVSGGLLK